MDRETPTLEEALVQALHSFSDADKRWEKRRQSGRTDAQLQEDLGYEFGISGGSSYQSHAGGKNPKFWYTEHWSSKKKPTLEGRALVDKVRELLKIGNPERAEQMRLF